MPRSRQRPWSSLSRRTRSCFQSGRRRQCRRSWEAGGGAVAVSWTRTGCPRSLAPGIKKDARIPRRTRLRCASAAIVRANLARPNWYGRVDGPDGLRRDSRSSLEAARLKARQPSLVLSSCAHLDDLGCDLSRRIQERSVEGRRCRHLDVFVVRHCRGVAGAGVTRGVGSRHYAAVPAPRMPAVAVTYSCKTRATNVCLAA